MGTARVDLQGEGGGREEGIEEGAARVDLGGREGRDADVNGEEDMRGTAPTEKAEIGKDMGSGRNAQCCLLKPSPLHCGPRTMPTASTQEFQRHLSPFPPCAYLLTSITAFRQRPQRQPGT